MLRFTNKPDPKKINDIGAYYGEWFYKHVEKVSFLIQCCSL